MVGDPGTFWDVVLIVYCFVASILPVWLLLQPRDYLSSYLLFGCLAGGLVGIVVGAVTGNLGGSGDTLALGEILGILRDADDRDPWLRHAAAHALTKLATGDALAEVEDIDALPPEAFEEEHTVDLLQP